MDSKSDITTDDTRAAEVATVTFQGREFSAGGFYVDVERGRMIAYVSGTLGGGRETLTTWEGTRIAGLRVTGRGQGFGGYWGRPAELIAYQTTEPVAGFYWYGRGLGAGMVLKLRRGRKAR